MPNEKGQDLTVPGRERGWLSAEKVADLEAIILQVMARAGGVDLKDFIRKEVDKLMATVQEFGAKLDELEKAVGVVGQEIADLRAQIAAGGMTAAEEDAAEVRIGELTAKLLGA